MVQPSLEGFDEPMTASQLDTVAAAHAVLSGQRQATRIDLLMSTVLEVLSKGSLELPELLTAVQTAWPGAGITPDDLEEALRLGQAGGQRLFLRTDGLQGPVWRLDDEGIAEADTSQRWIEGVRLRLLADLRVRAASDFRTCTQAEAELWLDRLIKGLRAGLVSAEEAYLGALEAGPSMVLRPKALDQAAMISTVTDGAASDVSEFLRAAALAALDPTDPFGTELVSTLSTVCVLHGLLARLDVADAQKKLGALDGVVAVLDTPTLTYLVGGATMREPVERMIAAAVDSGVRVVALEHYLDELKGVVEAAGREAAAQATQLADPEARQAYLALAEGDDLLVRYYQLCEEGVLGSWVEFEKHVAALRSRLTSLGVEVRPHGNSDREQVASCEVALRDVLNENGGRGRSRDAIERDSETLSMALRHRRHFRRDKPLIKWPGLIVLTSDRRLARAYAKLEASEQLPLVLRLEQFTLMLARVRPVPEVRELTEAASRMLTRDIAEAVAMRYPPAIACQLATTLSGAGGATDVRVAQFRDVHDVLKTADTQDLLGEVVRRRALRTRESTIHTSRLMESQLAAHGDAADSARIDRETAAVLQQDAQRRESLKDAENDALRQRLAAAMTLEDLETLRRRTGVRSFLVAMNLAVAAFSLFVSSVPAAGIITIAGILLWAQSDDWVRDPVIRLRSAAVGIAADSVGLLVFLWAVLRH